MNLKSTVSIGIPFVMIASSFSMASDLLISGVYDHTLSGGLPKGVELYVVNNIADLSVYGLGSANNAGCTDGEEFTFPAEAAKAGSFIYVAYVSSSNPTAFMDYFGFAPNYLSSAVNINGDDSIELFQNGAVADVYGEVCIDGTGDPWEYMNGWAYRNDGVGPNGGVYNESDFYYSGANATNGCKTNATCGSVNPLGTYSPGGGEPNVIVVEQMGYSFVPDSIDVNIGDTVRWIWGNGDHSVVDSEPGTCNDVGQFFDEDLEFDNPTVEWTVTKNAPAVINYICDVGQHCSTYNMVGVINVLDAQEPDSDGDGISDNQDNCPDNPNPGQEDCNDDGVGDACSADKNGNGYPDVCETAPPFIQLQELRTDNLGTDVEEYFEIRGDQSMDLTGVWYIVIGDGSGGSGTIECAIDLSEMSIPANGSLLVAEDTMTIGTPDYEVNLNFENSDNVTHFLAMNFYGSNGDDLDTDDDGFLDVEPWQETIDGVRLIEIADPLDFGATDEWTYLDFEAVGPFVNDDGFEYAPAHVYRCTSSAGNWMLGVIDLGDPNETPGTENPACVSDCPADIDGDSVVNVNDLLALIAGWGSNDSTLDIDGDGVVAVNDLLMLISAWGPC